jgi:exonuclease SbcD
MPPESSVRILFVGDMHLGLLPSSVPDAVIDQGGFSARDLGPAAAWERIVDAALAHRVHAVALAGDLVDRDNAMFEAYGPLASGVRRLVEHGIVVAAVAGNHDTEVLPRLAAEIEGFHLLGPGGTWSQVAIPGDQGLNLQLVGWSFPARHHTASPLRNELPPLEGITLGLLHADLDAFGSEYAPVRKTELAKTGLQGWFLGHIHRPDEIPADGEPFYLGSVTGLNPNETGLHGPVLVQVSGNGALAARRLPLAPLRWEKLTIDCSELEDPVRQIESHLLGRLGKYFGSPGNQLDEVRALGVRLTLTGAVDDPATMENILRNLDLDQLVTRHQGTVLFVQKITNRLVARIDLFKVAERADPPGLFARRILALENPHKHVPGVTDPFQLSSDLVEQARQELTRVDSAAAFKDLMPDSTAPSADRIREILIQSGRLALAGMLNQSDSAKEAGHAVG